jgi:predicted nucleotidyltransferase component of viral defense system
MIRPGEISKISVSQGVRPQQIEKDYVITWVLWGIAQNDFLRENLVFKGGTCLRKIHFEDYRYSEDMDFTIMEDSITNDAIFIQFNNIFRLIAKESRLKLSIDDDSIETHELTGSIKFYIDYIGPGWKR